MIALTNILIAGMATVSAQGLPKPGPFETDEAARCAAVLAFTLDAMQVAPNVPRQVKNAIRDGLAIWEYELAASAPGATPEMLQKAANRAVAYVRADMPAGEGSEGARERGNFLQSSTKQCHQKVVSVYGDAEHPVIPYLRQAEVAVTDPTPTGVAAPLAANAIEEGAATPKKRKLR